MRGHSDSSRVEAALVVVAFLLAGSGSIRAQDDCNGNGVPDTNETVLELRAREILSDIPFSDVIAADFDLDGDRDLAAASDTWGLVVWLENIDGQGGFSAPRTIDSVTIQPESLVAADLDGDGDQDLLYADSWSEHVVWRENTDGAGSFGPRTTIASDVDFGATIVAADMDGDHDLDVLWSSASRIGWNENMDGAGSFGPLRVVDVVYFSSGIAAGDIDGDGDLDIFSEESITPCSECRSMWYENLDGRGQFGSAHEIAFGFHWRFFAVDMDGDGDQDFTTQNQNGLGWYKNINGLGAFQFRLIESGTSMRHVVLDFDVDGDGDLVVARDNGIRWFAYQAASGVFTETELATLTDDVAELFVANLDSDDDPDIVVALDPQGLVWLENTSNDCNFNSVPDECETGDCDSDGNLDECAPDFTDGSASDCTGDGVADECRGDCNANGVPDACDITGSSDDCDGDGVPDECQIDCNLNGTPDTCDIAMGVSEDCDDLGAGNGVPDECELDCNLNDVADGCDLIAGVAFDCNLNGVLDACDLAAGTSVDCNEDLIPDDCSLTNSFVAEIIGSAGDGPAIVAAGDLDGDGDNDLVAYWAEDEMLGWHENFFDAGLFGPRQSIDPTGLGSFHLADIDDDGDLDIAASVPLSQETVWYENQGGAVSFARHSVADAGGAFVFPADVDGDDDLDLVFADSPGGVVGWVENVGSGAFGSQTAIDEPPDSPAVVVALDVDEDQDLDIVAGSLNGALLWYANDGAGAFVVGGTVDPSVVGLAMLTVADIDGDQDEDLLCAAAGEDRVLLYENIDGSDAFDAPRLLGRPYGPQDVFAADLDADGDLDVVSASSLDHTVAWFENLDGATQFGAQRTIADDVPGASSVFAVDLGGDELPDIVSAAFEIDRLIWFANRLADCNANGVLDECDILSGLSTDCDLDGSPDECQPDCDGDGIPNSCEPDCDFDGVSDSCELYEGLVTDCNANLIPDDCDIASGSSADCALDGVPDECEPDCNENAVPDSCDILEGYSEDCDTNDVPDECAPACDGSAATELLFRSATVSNAADGPRSVHLADLDGDGRMDVLSASYHDDKIAWYAAVNCPRGYGPQQIISTEGDGPWSVLAVDVDGDGDADVLSASINDSKIAWYENLDGAGSFGPQQLIADDAIGAEDVFASDLDGDGDVDVLSASYIDDVIAWYPNDGAGSFTTKRIVSQTADGASSVFAMDLDGDGDVDVLSSSDVDDEIAWYENRDGSGDFGAGSIISATADGAQSVFAADLDGDGDADVLSASIDDDVFAWYENLDGAGSFGGANIISTALVNPRVVTCADLDGDADPDVLWVSQIKVGWFENTDGAGTFGAPQILGTVSAARDVLAADMDGDGDTDVAVAGAGADEILWFENTSNDCNGNGIPDTCEADCNGNGIADSCDLRGDSVDCNGNTIPDECDTGCADDCDSDGDGCDDELDTDPDNPLVCADSDQDGCEDCSSGGFEPDDDGTDSDGDGSCDVGDCLPQDAAVWSDPGAASGLTVTAIELVWDVPIHPGGLFPRYDTLRSPVPEDFNGPAECVESNGSDTTSEDPSAPLLGGVLHYLIRVENDCPGGTGSMGSGSNGVPRSGLSCP